ncbi:hypothetical protein NDU88_007491 [Pleurodeles waltl]|uniref:Uncharacterized protein n=1 Tax=Pleurodeles waltl TaxID=8319 RepID=A0AAV7MG74_PLEWA|nr:hypothetical protein NDU88_007491 [Pleurodeles waltl]
MRSVNRSDNRCVRLWSSACSGGPLGGAAQQAERAQEATPSHVTAGVRLQELVVRQRSPEESRHETVEQLRGDSAVSGGCEEEALERGAQAPPSQVESPLTLASGMRTRGWSSAHFLPCSPAGDDEQPSSPGPAPCMVPSGMR